MTSCDNHETYTSFTSPEMEKENKTKQKMSDLSFLQKLGKGPVLQKLKENLSFILRLSELIQQNKKITLVVWITSAC